MRHYVFEALALLLLLASVFFFYQTVTTLTRRDYIASLILLLIGLSMLRAGTEMARVALVDRS